MPTNAKRRPTPTGRQKKGAKTTAAEEWPANYAGHVQYFMSREVKKAVLECAHTQAGLLEHFTRIVDDGYRFSLEYDEKNAAYAASLFQRKPGANNEGYILAARHVDITRCLAILYIMHEDVFDTRWPTTEREANGYDW